MYFAPAQAPRIFSYINGTIPAGNTVTSTAESAWTSKAAIPSGTLKPGQRIWIYQSGVYSAGALSQTIIPRLRLGGTLIVPEVTVMGLLFQTNVPWSAEGVYSVLDNGGIVGGGRLYIANNEFRQLHLTTPVTGINFATAMDLTGSAQWGGSSNTITCQQFMVEVV